MIRDLPTGKAHDSMLGIKQPYFIVVRSHNRWYWLTAIDLVI